MAVATAYTWSRSHDVQRSLGDLRGQVGTLTTQVGRLSDAMDARLGTMTFREAFDLVAERHPTVHRVRIRAVTIRLPAAV